MLPRNDVSPLAFPCREGGAQSVPDESKQRNFYIYAHSTKPHTQSLSARCATFPDRESIKNPFIQITHKGAKRQKELIPQSSITLSGSTGIISAVAITHRHPKRLNLIIVYSYSFNLSTILIMIFSVIAHRNDKYCHPEQTCEESPVEAGEVARLAWQRGGGLPKPTSLTLNMTRYKPVIAQ